MKHYLYLITRDDGEKYVGVSIHPDKRLKQHIAGKGSKHLKGYDNLKLSILAEGEKDYIYGLEDAAIIEHEARLNIAIGGFGGNTGNYKYGEDNKSSKVSEDIVKKIRLIALDSKITYKSISDKYNISKETVRDICRGRTWKSISGHTCKARKIIDKEQIALLYSSGISPDNIACQLDCSRSTVYNYLRKNNLLNNIDITSLKQACKADRLLGMTFKNIAAKYNIGLSTAHRYCGS